MGHSLFARAVCIILDSVLTRCNFLDLGVVQEEESPIRRVSEATRVQIRMNFESWRQGGVLSDLCLEHYSSAILAYQYYHTCQSFEDPQACQQLAKHVSS